eukprot:Skav216800  [mRNA]  locus=scaffold2110:48108:49922:- [translate_table: standard]
MAPSGALIYAEDEAAFVIGVKEGHNRSAALGQMQTSNSYKLCIEGIRSAGRAGVDFSCIGAELCLPQRFRKGADSGHFCASVLGLAILFGQPDCAVECVRLGVEVTELDGERNLNSFLKRHLEGQLCQDEPELYTDVYLEGPSTRNVAPVSECKAAASAAGRAIVRRDAVEKQVAIYQVMMKMFGGGSFPTEVVHSIGTFSVRVPRFVEQLGLYGLVEGWLMPVPLSNALREATYETSALVCTNFVYTWVFLFWFLLVVQKALLGLQSLKKIGPEVDTPVAKEEIQGGN